MTKLLITSQQVIDLAFAANEKITPVSIKETKIDAAQEKYIRPVLGKLYDALVAGKYPELLKDYIQPALAYYVRYSSIPDLALKLNDKGAQLYTAEYANSATDKQRAEMRQQAKDDANALLDKAVRYISEKKTEFPEYDCRENIRNKVISNGGIIL